MTLPKCRLFPTRGIAAGRFWAFPVAHCLFVAFDRMPVGLLRSKAQGIPYQQNMGQAKFDAVQPMDEHADALERPEFGLKAELAGLFKEHTCQAFNRPLKYLKSKSAGFQPQLIV